MHFTKIVLAVGAASALSTAAVAADLPISPPPQYYAPPPAEEFGGWYLRGDIGFSNQKVKSLDHAGYGDPGISLASQSLNVDTGGIFGLGIGYQFNNWFRGDITGQYRGNASLHGRDLISFNGEPFGANVYNASKSEWVVMANAYVDLGTWWCVTPFIGAGVGMARNTFSGWTDQGIAFTPAFGSSPTTAYAAEKSKWNLAWALHTGLAYKVNPGLTIELAYSYMNLGNGGTGGLTDYLGFTRGREFTVKDITSHDLKLGVRWNLDSPPSYAPPPPLMRRG